MTELDLSSELAVISGAAGGLGRLVCGRLVVLGADAVAVDLIDDLVPPIGHDGDRARAMALDANPECVTFNFYSSMRPAPTK